MGTLLVLSPVLLALVFGGSVTSSTGTSDVHASPSTGSARIWMTLLVGVGAIFLFWRQILGRLVSLVVTYFAAKHVQRIKVGKVVLKPLQFFDVELITNDGWRVQLSRVQLDVRLKTFFSSFGQMKLVWVVIDALSVVPPPRAAGSLCTESAANPTSTDGASDLRKPLTAMMGVMKFTQLQIKALSCIICVQLPVVVDGSAAVAVQVSASDIEMAVNDISASTGIMTADFSHSSSTCQIKPLASTATPYDTAIFSDGASTVRIDGINLVAKVHYLTKSLHEIQLLGSTAAASAVAITLQSSLLQLIQQLPRHPRPSPPAPTLNNESSPFVHASDDLVATQLLVQSVPMSIHIQHDDATQLSLESRLDKVLLSASHAQDDMSAVILLKSTRVYVSATATVVPWITLSSIECHVRRHVNRIASPNDPSSPSADDMLHVKCTLGTMSIESAPPLRQYLLAFHNLVAPPTRPMMPPPSPSKAVSMIVAPRHVTILVESQDIRVAFHDSATNEACVVATTQLSVEARATPASTNEPSTRHVRVAAEKMTLDVAAPSGDKTQVAILSGRMSGSWSPLLQLMVELDTAQWTLDEAHETAAPTRRPPTLQLLHVRINANEGAAVDDSSGDGMHMVVHIHETQCHWNHGRHVERIVAMHALRATMVRVKQLHAASSSPSPHDAASPTVARPLDLAIVSSAVELQLTGMSHMKHDVYVFSATELNYHLDVAADGTKTTVVHAALGLVQASDDAKLVELRAFSMHVTKEAVDGAEAIKVDVTDLTLTFPDSDMKFLVFVKHVQNLFNTSIGSESRAKPPLDVTAHIANLVANVHMRTDDDRSVLATLSAHVLDVKTIVLTYIGLPPTIEALLLDNDTSYAVADYRNHVIKVLVLDTLSSAHDAALHVVVDDAPVLALQVESATVSGHIHDLALAPTLVFPRKRLCLGLRVDVKRPAMHVQKVFVALDVVPLVVHSVDDMLNTSVLDDADAVKMNPRHKFFGHLDVGLAETSWTAVLTSTSEMRGRLERVTVAVDKTRRVECHVHEFTLDLSTVHLLQMSEVHWTVQFALVRQIGDNTDVWHAVVSGSITSHDVNNPRVMENKLSLEWTSVVAVAKKFLTEQLLPPRVERKPPPHAFNALDKLSVSLALRPIQLGWSEASAPTLFHFETHQVELACVLTKEPLRSDWTPDSFRVSMKSVQGFIMEDGDTTKRPNSFFLQAASVDAVSSATTATDTTSDAHIPIQVEKLKLLWTVALRDHIFQMVDVIHDDVVTLKEIIRGTQLQRRKSGRRLVPGPALSSSATSSFKSPASPTLQREKSCPSSLLDLLQQGKLGNSEQTPDGGGITSSCTPTPLGADAGSQAPPYAHNMHFPVGLVLVKQFSVNLLDAQINVAEPESKSSMIIASRHIQVDVGKDPGVTHTLAEFAFKEMTCHVAPLDVDIDAGVLWYNPRRSVPSLLQAILNECSLSCKYKMSLANKATFIQIDLPTIVLSMDSNQFYQCLSVVRHVLLAPPKVPRPKQATFAPLTADKHMKIKKVQAAVADELRMQGLRAPSTCKILANDCRHQSLCIAANPTVLKCVAFHVGRAQCRFRAGNEDGGVEFVALRLDEAEGSHVYFDDTCTKFGINLQWLEIQNLKPGASSMVFDDPMAVLKARLEESQQVKTMLSVRAESKPLPPSATQPGVRVYDMLEVSIFPGIPYDISIQLAVEFYELMIKFFFGNVKATPLANDVVKMQMMTNPALVMGKFGKKELTTRPASLPVTTSDADDNDDDEEITAEISSGAELFYFNYVRIGNICLHIACHGFVVNLNGFELELPHFVCQSKLCTWKQLLRKFEGHLAWHVTKESASSGLNHVKKKLLTLNKTFKRKEKAKKEPSENMATLFGPYHHHEGHQ
ncbi:Aste57867_13844 [Aphanomyces stellatus]|uniref:Aste57867_13844 protein n=1 Tax=Aphanomyces stellatus TaxID=120398 RepID=A0A485KZR0_9STRA|nr:hypothetical protein As57867_013793 [Aphanomyces stellatus]VFT90675.1 Aste57867_13844 [Aphanomyces stellatus]